MTILMSIALALIAIGATLAACSYKFAPVSDRFAGWDLALMGGISTTALGSLGALLLAFTA